MKNQEKDGDGHPRGCGVAISETISWQKSGGDKNRPAASKMCKKEIVHCHLF
jgi:hypothetical protein